MKPFEVKGWSHIMIEGYCTINQEYHSKHSKWVYGWKGNKNPEDRGKKPNPEYDPNVKPNKKPKKCLGHISIECIKCRHLAYADIEPNLRAKISPVIKNYFDEVDEEEGLK